ncbi:MAG TPA: hypothetical protein VHB30_15025 [Solirubrobacteraceae bacterium]|nr:hypothetical protein [Solirubrobacteraceae bacterium]
MGAQRVAAGHLVLAGFGGWLGTVAPPWLGRLMPGTVAVEPVISPGVNLLVGDVAADAVPRLLADVLTDGSDRAGRAMARGALQARLYSGAVAGHAPLRAVLALVPSTAGVSAALCLADPRLSATASDDCVTALTTALRLHRADPRPAVPARAEVARLRDLLRTLDARRRLGLDELGAAPTSGRQANAAQHLASAYAAAGRAAATLQPPPLAVGPAQRLADALALGAAAYERLGAAADEHSPAAFRRARSRALAADRAVQGALAALAAVGYASA